eukprot:677973-Amphidinium_carterae.1
MTGCISLEKGGAHLSAPPSANLTAPKELEYLHRVTRVIRALLQIRSVEIQCDQRYVAMGLKERRLETGSTVLTAERTRMYRSLVMRIAYLSLDRAYLIACVQHVASRLKNI